MRQAPSRLRMIPRPAGHPLTSGRSTPTGSTIEAALQAQEEELNSLLNGQAAANSSIALIIEFSSRLTNQLSQSHVHDSMMPQMTEHADSLCLHLDSRMAIFAQAVEAPVQQAVQASTTAAGMPSDLAGRYAGMQDDLERTFNAATAAHHASEYART
jgi:hypothetical protein